MTKKIQLKAATLLTGAYEGRGIPRKSKLLPAGTVVSHRISTKVEFGFIHIYHEVYVMIDHLEYSAVREVLKLEEAFNPETYHKELAIQMRRHGVWMSMADMNYYADDGFGNMVKVPFDYVRASTIAGDYYATLVRLTDEFGESTFPLSSKY